MIEYETVRPLLATVDDDAVRTAIAAYDAALAAQADAPGAERGARRRAELEVRQDRRDAILEGREATLTRTHINQAVADARDTERRLAAHADAVAVAGRRLDAAVRHAGAPMLCTVLGEYVRLGWPNDLPRHLEILWTAFAWPRIAERPGELVVERNPHHVDPTRSFHSTLYRVDRPGDRRDWWPIPPPSLRWAIADQEQSQWRTHVITELTRTKGKGFDVDDAGTLVLRKPEPAWRGRRRPRRPGDPGRPHHGEVVWVGGAAGFDPDQLFG